MPTGCPWVAFAMPVRPHRMPVGILRHQMDIRVASLWHPFLAHSSARLLVSLAGPSRHQFHGSRLGTHPSRSYTIDEMVKCLTLISYQQTVPPNEIRKLREKVGLTQRQFARLLGVTHQTVINWEKGRTEPPPVHVELMERWRNQLHQKEQRKRLKKLLTAGGALGVGLLLDWLNGDDD